MSRLGAATFAALLAWSTPAVAEFPEKPVDYIIPFGAGGESGITARLQQPVFMKLTGQDLVVKYRPGGGGAVAWSQLNEMPDDGHTLIGVNLPHILLQPLRGANYKTEDLGIVHIFHYTPHAILVREESQYKTLEDLIKVMNANPGKVSFSGSGRGTANHLAQVWFDERLRAKSAYNGKKGTAAAVAALLDEQVDASWAYTTGAVKYGDKLRMLAVAMEKRHPKFPDVPTFRELGYDFVGGAYRGVAVPKSTTEGIRLKISKLFGRIGDDPAFKARKSKLGFVPLSIGYNDIPAFMTSRRVEYLPLAREAGLID
ncbi:MAG: tripartite tricarboxylate transporter substrate binding protein [Alphaproteobacteria bacterium]